MQPVKLETDFFFLEILQLNLAAQKIVEIGYDCIQKKDIELIVRQCRISPRSPIFIP